MKTRSDERHGLAHSSEYQSWQNMKARCYVKSNREWKNYGGRGIKVCDRWKCSFKNFIHDMGFKPTPLHSVDRVNGNGDYEPSNCRWADKTMQSVNQKMRKDNKAGFRGVRLHSFKHKYTATINIAGKSYHLGMFNTKEEAANMYDQFAVQLWPGFCKLNFEYL